MQTALEASGVAFDKVDVNLYGSGGFDKAKLKEVEKQGGLSPKGYIPVMRIDDEVIRESSVLVERVAAISSTLPDAQSLAPEQPALAEELVAACNALPKSSSSRQLDALLKRADQAVSEHGFLAGSQFSIADACLLPFIQRVQSEGLPSDLKHLSAYYDRCMKLPAFANTVASSWWWWW